MLHIENLHVYCNDVKILHDLSLHIGPGELHIIMGPNGAGKSTFAKVLSGDDSVAVASGSLRIFEEDLLDKAPEERAQLGLFVGFQVPPEIPGVNNKLFLKDAYNACRRSKQAEEIGEEEFDLFLTSLQETYDFVPFSHFLERDVNEGFSGGERKKNEIWQMLVLEPEMVFLDEPDSGLDVDSLRFICKTIEKYRSLHPKCSLCIITHNPKLGQLLRPDYVHILLEGSIVQSGDITLMQELEHKSYHEVLEHASRG
ncbi:feS assembly ATPase SufC [Chlamydia ibidis]|uniref:FeS assembly ATPase SufC n=2 Tax=Chlamydia ibidis TaxID=1405396 RepID=S7J350_9CHLA|nr:Fe-S cluster assembly ATPase SufC [Chlamydia ibidis]EPP34643.1 feS assembly ATPase SufC [Chlamydia ibidis]EQM63135.1 FeS assembly ATPase SufC [Chlamydia ibidis 10-1398/6]